MRGRTPLFDSAVRKSGTAVIRVDIIRDGKVVQQPPVHAGHADADRTAAQMRSFEVEVSDPDTTLTPAGMQSLLAPFGTRMQLWRGVQITNVQLFVALHTTQSSWTTTTAFGVNNGTVGSPTDGALTMGP